MIERAETDDGVIPTLDAKFYSSRKTLISETHWSRRSAEELYKDACTSCNVRKLKHTTAAASAITPRSMLTEAGVRRLQDAHELEFHRAVVVAFMFLAAKVSAYKAAEEIYCLQLESE